MNESIYVLGDEDGRKFARLVAAAWADSELRARYESEPRALLSQYGIAYPEGVPAPPLPPKPEGELDIMELEIHAGSTPESTASSVACYGGCLVSVCFACSATTSNTT
jgi:putative thiazole/oxazole-modified microcin (TOMM)-like peptide